MVLKNGLGESNERKFKHGSKHYGAGSKNPGVLCTLQMCPIIWEPADTAPLSSPCDTTYGRTVVRDLAGECNAAINASIEMQQLRLAQTGVQSVPAIIPACRS